MTGSIIARAPSGRDMFSGYVCDDAALDVLHQVVASLGWRIDACHKGGLRGALQALSVAASPAILLVDLSDCTDPLSDIDTLAEVCEPGTVVIATGRLNDVSLYRSLLTKGIHDYLPKPVSPEQLKEALERAQSVFLAPREEGEGGRASHAATAVIGTRGGVGTSMVATSLAWLLSTEHQRSTALLDLDVHFGTGALTLDLEPGRGLTDAIENPGRIDTLFLERAMIRANDRLSILSAEAPMGTPLLTDGSAFVQLAAEFRESFQASVIDLPRTIMINFPQILAEVNALVVTTELTLAAARDTIRILSWLKSNAPQVQPLIVANKVEVGTLEISEADFTAATERSIDFVVPYDHKAAVNAARRGKPFVEANRGAKCVAPLLDMANRVALGGTAEGAPAKEKATPSLLKSLDLLSLLSRAGKDAVGKNGGGKAAAAQG